MSDLYVKSGQAPRIVDTPSQRVAARFAGFQLAEDVVENFDRSALQEQAKALGIRANQTNEALAKAIADFKPTEEAAESGPSGEAPVTDDDESGTPSDVEDALTPPTA